MYTVPETGAWVKKISASLQMPIANPRGRKIAVLQEYLSRFTEEQLTSAMQKLAVSRYVKSNYFSLDMLVKEDVITTLLAGGVKEKIAISKYYKPEKWVYNMHESYPSIVTTEEVCATCGGSLHSYPYIFQGGLTQVSLCPTCNSDKKLYVASNSTRELMVKLKTMGVPHDCILRMFAKLPANAYNGAFFFGESGVGKTATMVSVMRELILRGQQVKFLDWSDFMCELKCDVSKYNTLIQPYLQEGITLFVDNFECGTGFITDYVFNAINNWYKRGIKVFYTAETLPSVDRIASRIARHTVQIEVVNGDN